MRKRCSGFLPQWLAHKAQQSFFLRPVPSSTHPVNRNENVTGLSQGLSVDGFLALCQSPWSIFSVFTFEGKVLFCYEENVWIETSIASPPPQKFNKVSFQFFSHLQEMSAPKQIGTGCPGWGEPTFQVTWLLGFPLCPRRCSEQRVQEAEMQGETEVEMAVHLLSSAPSG